MIRNSKMSGIVHPEMVCCLPLHFRGQKKTASKRAARRTCCTKTKFDAQSENCLELSPHPGYQSAPGFFQFLVGNFETKPSFVTGISGDSSLSSKTPPK